MHIPLCLLLPSMRPLALSGSRRAAVVVLGGAPLDSTPLTATADVASRMIESIATELDVE